MNVFEDLVLELQNENLLETPDAISDVQVQDENTYHLEETAVPNVSYDLPEYGSMESLATEVENEQAYENMSEAVSGVDYHESVENEAVSEVNVESADEEDMSIHETVAETVVIPENDPDKVTPVEETQPPSMRPKTGNEFFKKRAMAEVSSLQMVEHVITGVEREYMKILPKSFDDFNAKKSLHTFLHVDQEINSEAHATAEFTLMQETEAWCTALAARDRNMQVSSLRQYCENSRPALSSQAMLALGRFYRNLPYSESVRSKFDFIITRLFSRSANQEKRVCLFSRDEMLNHINTLYSDWSSISLYSAEDDDSKVMLTALSFEDLSIEAEGASSFDQLIESDFFSRLRMFKESISELFYAPQVTAAAIECNIRIGNAYVDLIELERKKMDAASLHTKYGDLDDQTVSEATGQSLQFVDLLRELSKHVEEEVPESQQFQYEFDAEVAPVETVEAKPEQKAKKFAAGFVSGVFKNAFSVNPWFLGIAVLLLLASLGLYIWGNYVVSDSVSTNGVAVVTVENTILKQYIKTAKISGETFYGQMLPVWDTLPKDKREELLQVVFKAAQEKGCKQVTLISKDGKPAAYVSATRTEVIMP